MRRGVGEAECAARRRRQSAVRRDREKAEHAFALDDGRRRRFDHAPDAPHRRPGPALRRGEIPPVAERVAELGVGQVVRRQREAFEFDRYPLRGGADRRRRAPARSGEVVAIGEEVEAAHERQLKRVRPIRRLQFAATRIAVWARASGIVVAGAPSWKRLRDRLDLTPPCRTPTLPILLYRSWSLDRRPRPSNVRDPGQGGTTGHRSLAA